jgi:hypothetical protein
MRFACKTLLVTLRLLIVLVFSISARMASGGKTSLVFSASFADFYIGVSSSFYDRMLAIAFSLPRR